MNQGRDRIDVQVARGILIAVVGIGAAALILWSVYVFFSNA